MSGNCQGHCEITREYLDGRFDRLEEKVTAEQNRVRTLEVDVGILKDRSVSRGQVLGIVSAVTTVISALISCAIKFFS